MRFDNTLMFYDDQAYTSPTSTELDLGLNPGNTGSRVNVYVVGTGIVAPGDVTLQVQDTATSGSGHAAHTTYITTPAELNAGYFFALNSQGLKRYVRLVLAGTPTAGTLTGGIVDDVQSAV